MSRDGALPLSCYLRALDPASRVPLRMVCAVLALEALLLLLPLGTPEGFAAVTSSCAAAFALSYVVPLLQRATVARGSFERAVFHLGALSLPVCWGGVLFLLATCVVLCLPPAYPITPASMNYTPAIVGGVGLAGAAYWQALARHHFKGPKVHDFEHEPWELEAAAEQKR